MAASTQALITLSSPTAQPAYLSYLSNPSSTHLTNEAICWLGGRIMLFLSSFEDYS
jgi:hypothetical protein